jgi:RND superfamily putative drug exporter
MQNLMLRLDAVVRRRRRWIIALWVLVLVAAVPFASRQSEHLSSGGFTVPGSQSQLVNAALDRTKGAERASLAVVLVPQKSASPAGFEAHLDRVQQAVRKLDHVELTPQALAAARRAAAADEPRTLVVALALDVAEDDSSDVAIELRDELAIGKGARDGVTPYLIGQGALWAGLQDVSKEDLASAEQTGFPIVLLILLGVFGSFAAALLPLALGVFSVLITGALIYFVSLKMNMSVFVTNMSSMIGIGVAVDYSLFVLARYREEIVAGHTPDAARARALATSGVAVVFSGLTVIISLAGLWMIDNNAIRSMALGAILVVAISLLGATTLLPSLIKAFGHRAYARSKRFTAISLALRSRRRRRRGSTSPDRERAGFWDRWTARVTKRPVVSVVLSSAVLLVLAIPALSLQMGNGALRQFPEDYDTRVGMQEAAKVTPPGATAQLKILVRGDEDAVEAVSDRLAADRGVDRVVGTSPGPDRGSTFVTALPRFDGESTQAKDTVYRLQDSLPDAAGRDASVLVGGTTAMQTDLEDLVSGSMWKVLLFVLGLSYLVLMVLLRSVLLPLKAVLMNLLSVGAAYGVLVAVFQWGWIDGFLGFESMGYVQVLTPPLVLAIVFGLSMDYEVFLLSRIRERFEVHGDNTRAVAEGLARSARTITSAALIMVSVFAVFVGTGVPSVKELGLGTAVAIAVDATLVRLVLVPAAMELMGKWNWWLPKPLARILPKTSFEELPEDVGEEPPPVREREPALA